MTDPRPWGTGSVYQHRGAWRARLPGRYGRRNVDGSYATRGEAEAALAAALEMLARAPLEAETLDAWGAKWIPTRDVREGVRQRDASRWRAYVSGSRLGKMAIAEIEPHDVAQWLAGLRGTRRATLSAQTRENALVLLRVVLEAARERGGPLEGRPNPASEITLGRRQRARTRERWTWLREHEIATVLGTPSIPERARLIYTVAIATGLRAGELWGLRWNDVDERRGVLHVRHSRSEATKGGDPREVPLLEPARLALERWREIQDRRSHLGLVYPAPHGGHHADGYDAGWSEHARMLGLRATFHDLRHTAASHLLMGTWAPHWIGRALRIEEVQRWLGHRSITTTQRYAHLAPEAIAALVQRDTARDTIESRFPDLNRGPTVYECVAGLTDGPANCPNSYAVSRLVARLSETAERVAQAIATDDPHRDHRALDLVDAAGQLIDALSEREEASDVRAQGSAQRA